MPANGDISRQDDGDMGKADPTSLSQPRNRTQEGLPFLPGLLRDPIADSRYRT